MRNPDRETVFHFKRFDVINNRSAMKVGTDGVLLGAWCASAQKNMPRRILDAGCGTGLIALMAAQRFPDASITGIDISRNAVMEAQENFINSPWSSRLRAIQTDFKDYADCCEKFDLVISNPPFFENGATAPDIERRVARHGSSLSLKALMIGATKLLLPEGILSLILPSERESELKFEATINRFDICRLVHVSTKSGKSSRRILAELVFSSSTSRPCVTETLFLRDDDGIPGKTYVNLVKDFYINY